MHHRIEFLTLCQLFVCKTVDFISWIWYDIIVNKIKKINDKVKQVKVKVNFLDMNNVIGHKKENIKKIKDTYNVDVIVEADNSSKEGKSELIILQTYDEYLEQIRENIEL